MLRTCAAAIIEVNITKVMSKDQFTIGEGRLIFTCRFDPRFYMEEMKRERSSNGRAGDILPFTSK